MDGSSGESALGVINGTDILKNVEPVFEAGGEVIPQITDPRENADPTYQALNAFFGRYTLLSCASANP
jgi:hypothetical protein